MRENRTTFGGISRKEIVIPPYSVATVDNTNENPNYYRVQNRGDHSVYCSTAHTPTEEKYDFRVPAQSMKLHAEPHQRPFLYIFNPSGNEITCVLLCFAVDFDPLVLALTELEIDLSSQKMETSSMISGFESPLPAGTNNIGKVTLDSGTNLIGVVGVQKAVSDNLDNLPTIKTNLESLLTKLNILLAEAEQVGYTNLASVIANGGGGGGGTSSWTAANIATLLDSVNNDDRQIKSVSGDAGTAAYIDHSFNSPIKRIHTISNDGEHKIIVKFTNSQGSETFTLMPGEVLNDIDCNISMVSVVGVDGASPYRILCSVFA